MMLRDRRIHLTTALLLLSTVTGINAQETRSHDHTALRPVRPVHTYSIVARDPATGELGVAVQSHWFSVGSSVPWAESGVGAVATQSFIDPSYGSLGLELMRTGRGAQEALAGLVAADPTPEVRQVGFVDANGATAAWTGDLAIPHACDRQGDGFTVQANLMHRTGVCDAMFEAYSAGTGDLAARLMAALVAAEDRGGDIRGRQSAALLVVAATTSGRPWEDRLFDLRVEDSDQPLVELERLLGVARAYRHMNAGDARLTEGDVDGAVEEYRKAEALLPGESEPLFWHAATLASVGRVEESLPLFAEAFELRPEWKELVPRLPAAELLPDDPTLIEEILNAGAP
ncbi:MAG: DUF1028 domain-containing protein [marine benthic group bacterium]|nr:DUF1028 domain-containing protein [Gemmatimonadota bacterium]